MCRLRTAYRDKREGGHPGLETKGGPWWGGGGLNTGGRPVRDGLVIRPGGTRPHLEVPVNGVLLHKGGGGCPVIAEGAVPVIIRFTLRARPPFITQGVTAGVMEEVTGGDLAAGLRAEIIAEGNPFHSLHCVGA